MSSTLTPRHKLRKELKLMLGDGMTEVELDHEHLDLAIDIALERCRQRTDGAMEESVVHMTILPGEQEYTLPYEVVEITKIYRRGIGTGSVTSATNFDPVSAGYANMYLLDSGRAGGLATWDFFNQYQELTNRMFAGDVDFTWNTNTKKLVIHRKFLHTENVLIECWNAKPEDLLLRDPYTGPWLRDYALARCKIFLGDARSKYSNLVGPSGSVTLNGKELKDEGKAEMERLDQELKDFVVSRDGCPFIVG